MWAEILEEKVNLLEAWNSVNEKNICFQNICIDVQKLIETTAAQSLSSNPMRLS